MGDVSLNISKKIMSVLRIKHGISRLKLHILVTALSSAVGIFFMR